ncbi:uncharacterized protein [Dysidea avara]|uniref:uncharacterized protein n=1 Tax=Dysidea avara TaxID=196820 RepID=UPI0033304CAD
MAANMNSEPSPPSSPILYESQGEDSTPQVSEEAILDQLFMSCVTDNNTAPVEDIITKVRGVVSAENQGYVLELFDHMMRDSSIDGCVNFDTFQHVIQQWVLAVKQQRSASSSPRSQSSLSISQMSESSHSEVDYDYSHAALEGASHNFTLETSGGESFVDQHSELDLAQSVQQLEYANERLHERNQKLQLQMESSEERMSDITTENEDLKRKLRQTQQTLDQRNVLIEDMKKEIDRQHSQDDMIHKLEQENKQYQDDLATANLQLQQLKQEVAKLEQSQTSQHQQKASLNHTNLQNLKVQLEEMESQNEELTAAFNELNNTHRDLCVEKKDLDSRVAELEIELASRSVNQAPVYASTPYAVTARCLKDEIGDHLPSFNTLALDTGDSSLYSSSKKDDESVDRLLGSLSPIPDGSSDLSSMDHFSIVTSQARTQFRQKKELAMKQIAELFTVAPSNNMESRKETLRQQLEDDMQSFEGKLSQLSQSKHISEKKVRRLIEYVKKLKVEMKQLTIEKGDSTPVNGDEPRSVHESSPAHQDQTNHLAEELAAAKAELQELTSKAEHQERQLQKAVKQEEATRITIATLTKDLAVSKAKCVQLEDTLDVAVTRHREELDDIMELVLAETANADKQLPPNLSSSISEENDHSERSLPPTSVRIKELVSTTIGRILSALSLSSGNLKLLKWAEGADVSQGDSDEDDASLELHLKVVSPSSPAADYNRHQSLSERKFDLQSSPLLQAAISDSSKEAVSGKAKLVHQKRSMDETPPSEEAHDLTSHDSPSDDPRSPSFVSLNNTGNTGGVKQRRTAVLVQPTNISELSPPEEHTEDEMVDKSATDNNEEGRSPSEGAIKDETDTTSVGVPQKRSLSVPSHPSQLKSILRKNSPHSLSLDLHDGDRESVGKRPPLQHKLSVQFTEELHQTVTVTPTTTTWEGHQPWMAVSPGTPYPLPCLPSPPPISLSQTRELSFLAEETDEEDIDKLSPDVVATRVNNMLVSMDTDNYTLARRRKDQFHAKETAIEDTEGELRLFSEELSQLTQLMSVVGPVQQKQVAGMLKHVGILSQSIKVVATKSEAHGCLLQEFHYSQCTKLLKKHISNLTTAKEALESQLSTCILPEAIHQRSESCSPTTSSNYGSLRRLYSPPLLGPNDSSPPSSPEPSEQQALAYQKGVDTGLQYNLENLKQREKECAAKCRSLSTQIKLIKTDQQKIILAREQENKTTTRHIMSRLIRLIHMILVLLLLALLMLCCAGVFVKLNDGGQCPGSMHHNYYPWAHILEQIGIEIVSRVSPM